MRFNLKHLVVAPVIALTFGLGACGGPSENPAPSASETSASSSKSSDSKDAKQTKEAAKPAPEKKEKAAPEQEVFTDEWGNKYTVDENGNEIYGVTEPQAPTYSFSNDVEGAASSLQTFLSDIDAEMANSYTAAEDEVEGEAAQYEALISQFPNTMMWIDEESLGQETTEELIDSYAVTMLVLPESYSISVDPTNLTVAEDGTVTITNKDMFFIGEEVEPTGGRDKFVMEYDGRVWKIVQFDSVGEMNVSFG